MLTIRSLDRNLPLFQALSSELRAEIFMLLTARESLTLKELSDHFQLSPATLKPHLQKLMECQLVYAEEPSSRSGTQYHARDCGQISIDFSRSQNICSEFQTEIPVGQYADFSVSPTCGLATPLSFLGRIDEPRFFTHPSHKDAEILWFSTGYIEYFLPNYIQRPCTIESLEISFEIASEAPQYRNDWPSDITFSLNGRELGVWTSPGDYGDHRGVYNPSWWFPFMNQYGLLKTLILNQDGCFLDGELLSSVTCRGLNLTEQSILRFRMEVKRDAPHPGGLTLFGRAFGDHAQGILTTIRYKVAEEEPAVSKN